MILRHPMDIRDWIDELHSAAAHVDGQSQRRAFGMKGLWPPLEKKKKKV